jgi:hypothetical protein
MLIFQPSVNFCSDKNIQTIFGTKLEDFLNYRIDYNLISQTIEKVVKNSYLYSKAAKSYFDEPREKLSSRPLCGRDKTISRSSKDFVAKVYTTFCVQPENL